MKKTGDYYKLKSNFLWNTFGSLFYFFTQWLISVLIIKISGDYSDAGLYALAMSVSSVFALISNYSIRQFQVSDIENKFQASEYVSHRIANIAVTFFICLIFCVLCNYNIDKILIIAAFMLFKLTESFTDVLHGIDQKHERMDIVGISFIIRGFFSLAAFITAYYFLNDLFIALVLMFLVSLILAVLFDLIKSKGLCGIKWQLSIKKYFELCKCCFSPFIFGLCTSVITTAPRMVLENSFGQEILGIFSSIAMPAMIVQVSVSYIFTPFVTLFTEHYYKKDKRFIKTYYFMLLIIIILGIITVFIVNYIGEYLLVLIFNKDIAVYSHLLVPTIICSFLTGIVWFLYTILVIIRRMNMILIMSISGVVLSAGASFFIIPAFGIDSVNYILITSYLFMIAMTLIYIHRIVAREFKD